MLADLDAEMNRREIDAIVVFGDTTLGNPDLTYVAGGNLARGGIYFKRANHDPLLLTSSLDFHNAVNLGRVRNVCTLTDYNFEKLVVEHGRTEAYPRLIINVLHKLGVEGKVTLAGRNDLAWGIYVADRLRMLGAELTGEANPTLLEFARETKCSDEINKIRSVGKKTAQIVNVVTEKLRNARRKRGHVMIDGQRATVRVMKKIISVNLALTGLIAPEGTIFTTGAASADPHNEGIPRAEIKESKMIVFDIFPQSECGYWFDMTRSFVIGRADEKSRRMYNAVEDAHTAVLDILRQGLLGEAAMSCACDVIERAGFKTLREIYRGRSQHVTSGFTHSLGHGVGLTIGERPSLAFQSKDPLKTGHVVTVEPGVYLQGYGGVRIEDTVKITSTGNEDLGNVRKEFELT
jgi:Xaa-Pro aminopeptidase